MDTLDREAAVKALDWLRSHCAKDEEAVALVRAKLGHLFGPGAKRAESGMALRAINETGSRKRQR